MKHVTLNFTVDRAGGFLSCIATTRIPNNSEMTWCDWHKRIPVQGDMYHVLGRGDRLDDTALVAYAAAHKIMARPWKAVDLAALDGR